MLTRRTLLLSAAGVGVVGLAAASEPGKNLFYAAITEESSSTILSAPEALARVEAGTLTLVDVRRPDEWQRTGSPRGALQLDLRRDDFLEALRAEVGPDPMAPVATICMRGVRSAKVANQMLQAGFQNVFDVSEGMLGSSAGPGWLKRGLPIVDYQV
jgi:rhodanese-related sulfurtransferase